jgi:hypothetical protein
MLDMVAQNGGGEGAFPVRLRGGPTSPGTIDRQRDQRFGARKTTGAGGAKVRGGVPGFGQGVTRLARCMPFGSRAIRVCGACRRPDQGGEGGVIGRRAGDAVVAKVVDRLALDMRAEFPGMRGFFRANLLYMRAFADAWPDPAIVGRGG